MIFVRFKNYSSVLDTSVLRLGSTFSFQKGKNSKSYRDFGSGEGLCIDSEMDI